MMILQVVKECMANALVDAEKQGYAASDVKGAPRHTSTHPDHTGHENNLMHTHTHNSHRYH